MALFKAFADAIASALSCRESGQTLVEYGLIISLIALAAIAGISAVAMGNDSLWGLITENVTGAIDSAMGR